MTADRRDILHFDQVTAGFEPVRDAFIANFTDDAEIGAGFAAYAGDERIIALYGGYAGPEKQAPMTEQTLLPVYSTGKGIASLVVARILQDHAETGYDTPVADVWPAFAAAGKEKITIGDLLSHQAGLPGFPDPVNTDLWERPTECAQALALCPPLWPPGQGSGYHPTSWGYLVGELVRRLSGESLGTCLRTHFTHAGSDQIDFIIGLSDDDEARCGRMRRPDSLPDFGHINKAREIAFFSPWNRASMPLHHWRRIEIPSTNGHGTAAAVARLYSIYANGGRQDGREVIAPDMFAALTTVRVSGPDRVLPFPVAFAAGVMCNIDGLFGPGRAALAHPGWGGSLGLGDPEKCISAAYVPNRQSRLLGADPRALRLINALYDCL